MIQCFDNEAKRKIQSCAQCCKPNYQLTFQEYRLSERYAERNGECSQIGCQVFVKNQESHLLEPSTCYTVSKSNSQANQNYFEVQQVVVKKFVTRSSEIKEKLDIFTRKRHASNLEKIKHVQMANSLFFKTQPRQFKINDFLIIKQIGSGTVSKVYLAAQKTSKIICSLKIISKQKIKSLNLQESVLNEIKIQFMLNHKNIIKLYGLISQRNCICLIQEYGGDQTLFTVYRHLKSNPLQQKLIAKYLKQIGQGIHQLHQNNIIHRDLKLENIIIIYGFPKITDLGCAVQSIMMRKTQIGSLPYFSPEQLKQQKYGKKKDMWSFGIIAYQLLCGKTAYNFQIAQLLYCKPQQRQLKEFKLPKNKQISEQAYDLLQSLLKINQWERISSAHAIKHPFLQ